MISSQESGEEGTNSCQNVASNEAGRLPPTNHPGETQILEQKAVKREFSIYTGRTGEMSLISLKASQ